MATLAATWMWQPAAHLSFMGVIWLCVAATVAPLVMLATLV
jgi:hypothetical protein